MKFLSWLFNVNKRHYSDFRRYENGKALTRIFSCVIHICWSNDIFFILVTRCI